MIELNDAQIWTIIALMTAMIGLLIRNVMWTFTRTLRAEIGGVNQRIDAMSEIMETRFGEVDRRFESVDRRLESVERRLDRLDSRVEKLDSRVESLDRDVAALTRRVMGPEAS